MSDIYIGGIDGGTTRSTAVIYNINGIKEAEAEGVHTNHWACGMEECQKRIFNLIQECKAKANIPQNEPLTALGLSLSGCEHETTNTQLKNGLLQSYPSLSKEYYVCSDTVAPIAAVSDKGGIVVISGTGSNALLINTDGSVFQSGGWGHLLGDEGSGYWIASQALKIYYGEQDNISNPPNGFSTNVLWEIIQAYFNIKSRFDILPYLYSNFDKSKIAGLCKEVAKGVEDGDPLCKWLFHEAGKRLARFVLALASKCNKDLLEQEGGLPVVCVGSVWKSWKYLEPGFHEELKTGTSRFSLKELSLLSLKVNVAVGAVYLATKANNLNLPRRYSDNYSVFYHYVRNH